MSKEEAIEILSEMRSEYNLFGDEEEATRYHVLSLAIKEMNAEPVRRGHWEDKYGDGDWHCSVCGAIVEKDEQNRHNWNRCYHCGAKMNLPEPIIYPQVEGITPTVVKMDEVTE